VFRYLGRTVYYSIHPYFEDTKINLTETRLSRATRKLRHGAQKNINAGVEPPATSDDTRQHSTPDENHHIYRNGTAGIHTTRFNGAKDR